MLRWLVSFGVASFLAGSCTKSGNSTETAADPDKFSSAKAPKRILEPSLLEDDSKLVLSDHSTSPHEQLQKDVETTASVFGSDAEIDRFFLVTTLNNSPFFPIIDTGSFSILAGTTSCSNCICSQTGKTPGCFDKSSFTKSSCSQKFCESCANGSCGYVGRFGDSQATGSWYTATAKIATNAATALNIAMVDTFAFQNASTIDILGVNKNTYYPQGNAAQPSPKVWRQDIYTQLSLPQKRVGLCSNGMHGVLFWNGSYPKSLTSDLATFPLNLVVGHAALKLTRMYFEDNSGQAIALNGNYFLDSGTTDSRFPKAQLAALKSQLAASYGLDFANLDPSIVDAYPTIVLEAIDKNGGVQKIRWTARQYAKATAGNQPFTEQPTYDGVDLQGMLGANFFRGRFLDIDFDGLALGTKVQTDPCQPEDWVDLGITYDRVIPRLAVQTIQNPVMILYPYQERSDVQADRANLKALFLDLTGKVSKQAPWQISSNFMLEESACGILPAYNLFCYGGRNWLDAHQPQTNQIWMLGIDSSSSISWYDGFNETKFLSEPRTDLMAVSCGKWPNNGIYIFGDGTSQIDFQSNYNVRQKTVAIGGTVIPKNSGTCFNDKVYAVVPTSTGNFIRIFDPATQKWEDAASRLMADKITSDDAGHLYITRGDSFYRYSFQPGAGEASYRLSGPPSFPDYYPASQVDYSVVRIDSLYLYVYAVVTWPDVSKVKDPRLQDALRYPKVFRRKVVDLRDMGPIQTGFK